MDTPAKKQVNRTVIVDGKKLAEMLKKRIAVLEAENKRLTKENELMRQDIAAIARES